jgi:hypothetical protein
MVGMYHMFAKKLQERDDHYNYHRPNGALPRRRDRRGWSG